MKISFLPSFPLLEILTPAPLAKLFLLGIALVSIALGRSANAQVIYQPYAITTFAGQAGLVGTTDGSGSAARFNYPYGIALDNAGNAYVADTYNYTIRKVTPSGVVSTWAGVAGSPGSNDGLFTQRFNDPSGLAVGSDGYIYVADTGNNTIRKIAPNGRVSTLAGSAGVAGSADGNGTAARFNYPTYVADTLNFTIRKITPSGDVSTLAGVAGEFGYADGAGAQATFTYPYGLAVTTSGTVFVADTYNYTIRKILPDGTTSTVAGVRGGSGSNDGNASGARFNAPRGIAVDGAGNVYVADEFSSTIRKLTPDGMVRTLAGYAGATGSNDGAGSSARFNYAAGVAVSQSGVLYVADTRNQTVRTGTPTDAPDPGSAVDTSFNAGNFTNGQVYAAILQPDGKVVIGGSFNKVHGIARQNLARLNADGTLDTSFPSGTGTDGVVETIVRQSDGKLLITGGFSSVNGTSRYSGLARLNADGSLDTAFDPGSNLRLNAYGNPDGYGTVSAVALQPDGKIILVGQFTDILTGPDTRVSRSCVARFNQDGSLDPSFNPGAGCVASDSDDTGPAYVHQIVRQNLGANAGKIIIAGLFDTFDGHTVPSFVRLNSDGSFDSSFSTAAVAADDFVNAELVQTDDRLVLARLSTNPANLVRLQPDGAIDPSFSTGHLADYDDPGSASGLVQQSDGKLIVTGTFHSLGGVTANGVVRLNTNGDPDNSFDAVTAAGPSGMVNSAAIVRESDGHIFLSGYFSTYGGMTRGNIAWVDQNGAPETTFAGLSGVTDFQPQIYALAVQPDGKIIVAGFFSSLNGIPHYNLVRLNPDATIDSSFNPSFQTEGSVRALYLQPDGKIVIAGNLRNVEGLPRRRVARLNSDGTVDFSFNPGTGADALVDAVTEDAAGNVYLGGIFSTVNGVPRRGLAKLSSSGVLDQLFQPDKNADGGYFVNALAPADNAIVVGGAFGAYQGVNAGKIVRVNAADAALDPTFNSGGSGFNSSVRSIKLGSDGKYSIGGFFGVFNDVPRQGAARLNNDGSLDTTFRPSEGHGSLYAVAPQGDRLLLGGVAYSTSVQPVRLTATGAYDESFYVGAGISIDPQAPLNLGAQVNAIAVQPDGAAIIGGCFNLFDGVSRVSLARVKSPDPTAPLIKISSIARLANGHATVKAIGFPNTHYTIQTSASPSANSFTGGTPVTAEQSGLIQFDDASAVGQPARFYRITLQNLNPGRIPLILPRN